MENAVKALLIAGGILLGIIIISAGVILYVNLNNNASEYAKRPEMIDIQSFNAVLEKYQGRTDIVPQDIVSIYNYIEQNSVSLPITTNVYINGFVKLFRNESAKIEYLKVECQYKCTAIEYENGQVVAIKFQKV